MIHWPNCRPPGSAPTGGARHAQHRHGDERPEHPRDRRAQPAAEVPGGDTDRRAGQAPHPLAERRAHRGPDSPTGAACAGYLTSISLLFRFHRSSSGTTSMNTAATHSVIVIPLP